MDVEGADSDEELERATQAKRTLELEPQPVIGGNVGEWFVERSKYIPMRLTLMERKYLRLLEAALTVSEYVCVNQCCPQGIGLRLIYRGVTYDRRIELIP